MSFHFESADPKATLDMVLCRHFKFAYIRAYLRHILPERIAQTFVYFVVCVGTEALVYDAVLHRKEVFNEPQYIFHETYFDNVGVSAQPVLLFVDACAL